MMLYKLLFAVVLALPVLYVLNSYSRHQVFEYFEILKVFNLVLVCLHTYNNKCEKY